MKKKERELLEREEAAQREEDRIRSWEREVRGAVTAAANKPAPSQPNSSSSSNSNSMFASDSLPLLNKIDELNKLVEAVRHERDVALNDMYDGRKQIEHLKKTGEVSERSGGGLMKTRNIYEPATRIRATTNPNPFAPSSLGAECGNFCHGERNNEEV